MFGQIYRSYYILNGFHCAKYYEMWQTLGVENLMNKMIWCRVVNFEHSQKYALNALGFGCISNFIEMVKNKWLKLI